MTRIGGRLAAVLLGTMLGCVGIGAAAGLSLTSDPLTPYRTCIVTGTPATTPIVTDSTARQANPNANYGTLTTMHAASSAGANRRVYVWFDLSTCRPAIGALATVRLATLRLYVSGLPAVCRTYDVFRVPANWTESGLTWNNQPFGTAINNPPSSSATVTFAVGTPGGCQNATTGYLTGATVTADVAAFVAGGATNLGWMIRDDVEGSAATRTTTFSAKNLGTLAQAPQLIVTYVTVP